MNRFVIGVVPYGWWNLPDAKQYATAKLEVCEQAQQWLIDAGVEPRLRKVEDAIAQTTVIEFFIPDDAIASQFELAFSQHLERP
jgi:hypothetical protein